MGKKPQPQYQQPTDAPPPYSFEDQSSSSFERPPPRPQQVPPNPQQRPPQIPQVPPTPQQPKLPWTYPRGYWCKKCHNTGYKVKNGKSCKNCWETFARQQNVSYTGSLPEPGLRIPFTNYRINDNFSVTSGYPNVRYQPMMTVPMAPMAPVAPVTPMRYLAPGDPSMGGYLCGRCRGTGRVSVMFIDDDLCPVCRGVGRVFS